MDSNLMTQSDPSYLVRWMAAVPEKRDNLLVTMFPRMTVCMIVMMIMIMIMIMTQVCMWEQMGPGGGRERV